MALKATVFKADISISDLNRSYYQDHSLTLARHPSETDLRMLLRVIVFALNADEHLQFTKGLSTIEEPDLWQKSLTGDIEHWIELGQPTEKRIRQSCGKSDRVTIYAYQKNSALLWFDSLKEDLERFKKLRILLLTSQNEALATNLVERSMKLSFLIEDNHVLMTAGDESLGFDLKVLKDFA